ncbi:MAG: hypothetical protein J6Q02_00690, partial [Lachnospiraceae bacterium]|nr:hypothetical protein [Lachnospiraceae bacterium]
MIKRITLKPKTWKMGRRVLACFMALLLALTGVMTIPELGMTAQAAVGNITYIVNITGGTGAVVDSVSAEPGPTDYKTTISPYNGKKLIRLQNSPVTDENLRFKQWNVTVQFTKIEFMNGRQKISEICSYSEVLTGLFFRGVDTTKLAPRDWTKVEDALDNGLTVQGSITIAA